MKEFKFWALTFSLNKLFLYTGAITIILLLIAINTNSIQQFLYLCIGIIFALTIIILMVIKRVTLTLEKERIKIKMTAKKEFIANIHNLQYIRGANINFPQSQGEINFVFDTRIITFTIFETKDYHAQEISKHCEILRALITTYSLEDKGQDKHNHNKMHVYSNPQYEPHKPTHSPKSKIHKT